MPTGLTHGVHDGKDDLRIYLWRVASQFFHHGEIDPIAKLRGELVSSFDHRSLEEAKVEMAKLRETTDEEFGAERARRHEGILRDDERSAKQKEVVRVRYEAMKAKVEAWTLPTPLLEGLKRLALKQLDESIEWDCRVRKDAPEVRQTPKEARAEAIQRGEESLARTGEDRLPHGVPHGVGGVRRSEADRVTRPDDTT